MEQMKERGGPGKRLISWRMRVVLIALVLSGGLVGTRLGITATPTVNTQAENGSHDETARVMALEVLWNQAEVNRDARAMGQLVADTLVYVDIDGSVRNKKEFLELIGGGGETMESLKNESIVAHEYPNTVVISGVYLEKGKMKGKPYSRRGRFTDTWVKMNGAWLCAASHSTQVEK